jgi:hypothetical protein
MTDQFISGSDLKSHLSEKKLADDQLQRMADPLHPSVFLKPQGLPTYLRSSDANSMISSSSSLKPKKAVLDEDSFVSSIENIIERDFFPNLYTIRMQRNKENDGKDLASGNSIHDADAESMAQENMKLGEFFANYNSEDNESFQEILQKDERDRQRLYHWAYDGNPNSYFSIEDAKKQKQNLMLYYMNGRVLTVQEREHIDGLLEGPRQTGDDRPAAPETWPHVMRNTLMFPPSLSSDVNTSSSTALVASASSSSSNPLSAADLVKKRRRELLPQKKIKYENTNFQENSLTSIFLESTMRRRSADGGGSASPLSFNDNSTWETDSTFQAANDVRKRSKKEYAPVLMTPLIQPGVDMSPLITWGEVAMHPIALSPPRAAATAAEHEPSFHIRQLSQREELGRKLDSARISRQSKSSTTPAYIHAAPATPLSVISKAASSISKASRISSTSASTSRNKSHKSRIEALTPAGLQLAQRLSRAARKFGSDQSATPFGGSLKL